MQGCVRTQKLYVRCIAHSSGVCTLLSTGTVWHSHEDTVLPSIGIISRMCCGLIRFELFVEECIRGLFLRNYLDRIRDIDW